jgi:thiamine pyrophosphate-dependent acetolactate synthase large subunit-like protein
MSVSGAQLVVSALERAGVDVVFGLPGVHNLALWPALAHSPIRLGAVGEAWASRSPVVVIATDVPTTLRREGVHRGLLHEATDQRAMFEPVTKATFRGDDVSTLGEVVLAALDTARAAPTRPAFLEVPTDLLAAHAESSAGPAGKAISADELLVVDELTDLVASARHPLLWVGGGAVGAGEAVGRLAERLAAPVLTTYSARGVLPPEHPCLVGLPPHVPEAGALWDEADLVMAIGSDLDGMMTQNWAQPAPSRLIVVNVDVEDATKNYGADLVIEGEATIAGALADVLPERDGIDALARRLADLRAAVRERMAEEFAGELAFLDAFAAAVPDDATIVCDMCIPGYWIGGFHPVPAPRRLAYPMGWGTLGWAFPAAIGSALGGAGPAVAVCGDGGFLFACGELATVAQERPPLTALIVDDGGYGMLRYDYARTGEEPLGVDLHTPDFVALAESFGVRAEAVDGLGDAFSATLARHVADPEPSVLVARAGLQPPPTTSPRWYRHR